MDEVTLLLRRSLQLQLEHAEQMRTILANQRSIRDAFEGILDDNAELSEAIAKLKKRVDKLCE